MCRKVLLEKSLVKLWSNERFDSFPLYMYRKRQIYIKSYDVRFSNGLTISIDPRTNKVYTIKENDQVPIISGPITIEQLLEHLKEKS